MSAKDVEERLRAMPADEKAAMQAEVSCKVDCFAAFFAELGNGELSRSEEALLRTYLTAEATGLLPSARPAP